MDIELSQDQKQKYQDEGLVAVEELIPENLFAHLQELKTGINQFQKDPVVLRLLTHRHIGQLLHQLTGERPIRLILSEVINEGHIDYRRTPFQGLLTCMVIPFSNNLASFFAVNTDYIVEEKSIVAVYGINDTMLIHADKRAELLKLYKENGYNINERLKSNDAPFVYR